MANPFYDPITTEWHFVPCEEGGDRIKDALRAKLDAPCAHDNAEAHFKYWLTIYYGREPTFIELTGAFFDAHDRAEVRYYAQKLAAIIADWREDRLGEEIWAAAFPLIEPMKWKPTQPQKLPEQPQKEHYTGLAIDA